MSAPTNSTHRELLNHSRELLLTFCREQNAAFMSITSEYLFSHAEKSVDNESQRRFFEARKTLSANESGLEHNLCREIEARFDNILSGKAGAASDSSTQPDTSDDMTLDLVDNEVMELEVAFKSMCHRAEADCAEALFALAQRTALLNGGSKLDEENNPYAPNLFCTTLQSTLETINKSTALETPTKLIVLKLFDHHFVRHLSMVYGKINDELIANNILPNLHYGGQRKENLQQRRRKSDVAETESENRRKNSRLSIPRNGIANRKNCRAN